MVTENPNLNQRGMNSANEGKEKLENEGHIENMLTQLTDTLKTKFSFVSKETPQFLVHVFGGNDSPISVVMFFPDTHESLEITGDYSYNPKSLKNLVILNKSNREEYKIEKYDSTN